MQKAEMTKNPRYIVASTIGSFIIPVLTFLLFFAGYGFVNPDGTPDNALVRSLGAIPIFCFAIFFVFLGVHASVGSALYRQDKQNLVPGAIRGSLISIPIPLVLYLIILLHPHSSESSWFEALTISIPLYIYFWVGFIVGSIIQLILVKRHNKSFKLTALRAAA